MEKYESIALLKNAIIKADFNSAPKIAKKALKEGVKPEMLLEEGISKGLAALEDNLFNGYKVWGHPNLFLGMEAARRSIQVLEPFLSSKDKVLGTIVLGTPYGDVHDFGGKMVAIALTAARFKVHYLGRDVPPSLYVHTYLQTNAQIIAISNHQTTGFRKIEEVIDILSKMGLRKSVNIMAGGSPITRKFANKMGIGYANSASGAVRLAKKIVGVE